jgi:two-component system, OmpR family, sensor kinase
MKRPTLRTLMLAPVLLTVSLGFAALAYYVQHTAQADLIAAVDEELARAHQAGAPRLASDPQPATSLPADPKPGVLGQSDPTTGVDPPLQLLLARNGAIRAQVGGRNPFSAAELADLVDATETLTLNHHPRYRVVVSAGSAGGIFVTALPLARADASLAGLRRSLLLGGLVVFLLCSITVWWIAAVLARPVTRMTAVANKIAAGALDTRVDPPTGSRETAQLANDLQHMLTRLEATIADRETAIRHATEARLAMQRFLADASHELRTPLTALKGYSDLYRGNMLREPDDIDRAMHRIGSESQRLTTLVNDMLQLAREGDTQPRPYQPVNLRQVVTGVVHDLSAAYPDHSISGPAPSSRDSAVLGDHDLLHQALLNLGANACQHTGPGTPVRFDVTASATHATVTVVDRGEGIDSEHVGKIFQPFYRADTSRRRTGPSGAGLGLTLTQQIATQHNASVSYTPTHGGGATFVLAIPRQPQDTNI